MTNWQYDGLAYKRRPTRTVHVGDVAVGSDHLIRVQSMTTPVTTDTAATVSQIERLVDAGCEIVRVTVPTSADADNLPNIRRELERRKVRVPLVADIHFTPAAAMKAVEHVDKIRINPGNYADKKKFKIHEYTNAEYEAELARIERVFSPLVLRAQELGVSMRIGTNHGSLSDRIMNRFGDTPEGMVESALEFVRICEARDYRELILSMKASNPVVVLQVYRLLAQRMAEAGMDYPFHLGVTEAGEGEDGRIKSAVGIGALLDEGIGDTVRVSLTEDPVREIPVALALVEKFNRRSGAGRREAAWSPRAPVAESRDPFSYQRRASHEVRLGPHALGGANPVRVEVPLCAAPADGEALRVELDAQAGVRVPEETRAEIVSVDVRSEDDVDALALLRKSVELVAPKVGLAVRIDAGRLLDADDEDLRYWLDAAHRLHVAADGPGDARLLGILARLLGTARTATRSVLVEVGSARDDVEAAVELAVRVAALEPADAPRVLMLAVAPMKQISPLHATRLMAARLAAAGHTTPIVLVDNPERRGAEPLLAPSAALGGLLCDGIGDAIHVAMGQPTDARRLAFNILQAARVRTTRTEFISCPSCGRTLFDLEETTARIKRRTAHLKDLKIAVMGCVVNGPGEMADADFGYVGWGEGKIALFVGKEMVAKDVPTEEADERLVELIKEHGRWVDPSASSG
jgi:(E)-4-hydroxy-3-methylbut-2-enyl-diphosphate synthase